MGIFGEKDKGVNRIYGIGAIGFGTGCILLNLTRKVQKDVNVFLNILCIAYVLKGDVLARYIRRKYLPNWKPT